jgi:hypothetical protein
MHGPDSCAPGRRLVRIAKPRTGGMDSSCTEGDGVGLMRASPTWCVLKLGMNHADYIKNMDRMTGEREFEQGPSIRM